MCEEKDKTNL